MEPEIKKPDYVLGKIEFNNCQEVPGSRRPLTDTERKMWEEQNKWRDKVVGPLPEAVICKKCIKWIAECECIPGPTLSYKPEELTKPEVFKKFDLGKTEWTLLPWKQVEEVVKVMMKGAIKYGKLNWQKATDEDADRYKNAVLRHLIPYFNGELFDEESGISHLAHAASNILFLMYLEDRKNGK